MFDWKPWASLFLALSIGGTVAAKPLMCAKEGQSFELTTTEIDNCRQKRDLCRRTLFKENRRQEAVLGLSCSTDLTGERNICKHYAKGDRVQFAAQAVSTCFGNIFKIVTQRLLSKSLVKTLLESLKQMIIRNDIGYGGLIDPNQKKVESKLGEIFSLSAWSKGAEALQNKYRWGCYAPEVSSQIMCAQLTILAVRYTPRLVAISQKALAADPTVTADLLDLLRVMVIRAARDANQGFDEAYGAYAIYAGLAETLESSLEKQLDAAPDAEKLLEYLATDFLELKARQALQDAAAEHLKRQTQAGRR